VATDTVATTKTTKTITEVEDVIQQAATRVTDVKLKGYLWVAVFFTCYFRD